MQQSCPTSLFWSVALKCFVIKCFRFKEEKATSYKWNEAKRIFIVCSKTSRRLQVFSWLGEIFRQYYLMILNAKKEKSQIYSEVFWEVRKRHKCASPCFCSLLRRAVLVSGLSFLELALCCCVKVVWLGLWWGKHLLPCNATTHKKCCSHWLPDLIVEQTKQ